MIQRIQSVYLLFSVVLNFIVFITLINGFFSFNAWLAILSFILALLSAFTIFSFKNRKKQLQLCQLLIVLHVLFTLFFAYFLQNEGVFITDKFGTRQVIMIIPIISILLINLAKKGVQKDDELVRSADRLR